MYMRFIYIKGIKSPCKPKCVRSSNEIYERSRRLVSDASISTTMITMHETIV